MLRFTEELIARVNRAGATGVKLLRADSGFWNTKVFERLEKAGWQYSIGVRMIKTVRAAVQAIPEQAWTRIDYPEDGEAQIAEAVYGDRRLIVRRTRLLGAQAELWPDWRHFAFITNRTDDIAIVEAEHRDHAVVEQVIADLKDQALAHFPSGHFHANAAWTVLAALTHNLLRWTELLGLPGTVVRAARTVRRRLLALPAASLATHAAGHCTCPPAGPGRTTSRPPLRASERFPPPPDALPAAATASTPPANPARSPLPANATVTAPPSRRDRFKDPTQPTAPTGPDRATGRRPDHTRRRTAAVD